MLANASAVAAAGRKFLLFVPYEEQRRYQRYIASDNNYHFYSWTPHTLANLVIECGFSLIRSARHFGYGRFCARLAATCTSATSVFASLWVRSPASQGTRGAPGRARPDNQRFARALHIARHGHKDAFNCIVWQR